MSPKKRQILASRRRRELVELDRAIDRMVARIVRALQVWIDDTERRYPLGVLGGKGPVCL